MSEHVFQGSLGFVKPGHVSGTTWAPVCMREYSLNACIISVSRNEELFNLTVALFLFKLFKQRHSLWRFGLWWAIVLVSGNEITWEKTAFSQHWQIKSARAQVVGIMQVKVLHWVQSTFSYTISEVQFLLKLAHSKWKQNLKVHCQPLLKKHYFYVLVCPKMNVLGEKRTSEGEKKTLKQSFKNARP